MASTTESDRLSLFIPNVSKVAAQRDNAKRFLMRLSNPAHALPTPKHKRLEDLGLPRRESPIDSGPSSSNSSLEESEGAKPNNDTRANTAATLRQRLLHHDSSASEASSSTSISESMPVMPPLVNEKLIASGNGIAVFVAQAEPVIFLERLESRDASKTAMLRGHLHVRVTKPTKIKKIYLTFKGDVTSLWPEGIPGKKSQYEEDKGLMTHTWPFFNSQFENAESSYGADFVQFVHPDWRKNLPSFAKDDILVKSRPAGRPDPLSKEAKRLSLQHVPSRSYGKGDFYNHQSVAHKGYKLFRPGDYIYNFELPIDSRLPESLKTDFASVKYKLDVSVERAGVFRPNLLGSKEVLLVRTPSQGSLEQVEPIAISRKWEDQLHYDIVISGKAFPLGAKIPIAFRLTPLAKVSCHRIKVYVTESVQQWNADRTAHRIESSRQILLFEKRAESSSVSTYPGSQWRVTAGGGIPWDSRAAAAEGQELVDSDRTNLLGDLEGDFGVGPTELEADVQLPTCPLMKVKEPSKRLHSDFKYENIEVHHWIKIVLRLSKSDESCPKRRRHFEISIDSPIHILSCLATQSNIFLPSYSSPSSFPSEEYECGCPGAQPTSKTPSRTNTSGLGELNTLLHLSNDPSASRRGSLTNTSPISESSIHRENPSDNPIRPIHLIRNPSFAPPAFEDVPPPPPAATPPPDYSSVIHTDDPLGGLSDYFRRLHLAEQDYDTYTRTSARVDVPLTPGGRVHRSIEIPRELLRVEPLAE